MKVRLNLELVTYHVAGLPKDVARQLLPLGSVLLHSGVGHASVRVVYR